MKLIRKQFYIRIAQNAAIKQLARQRGISESAILREVLDQFLAREAIMEIQDPFAGLVDMFEGPSQANHDDVYN